MKKLYTTLVAVLAIIQISYAQWTTSPSNVNNIVNTNPGNIGIGLTNPGAALEVFGSIAARRNITSTTFNSISINAGNANTAGSNNVNRIRVGGSDSYSGYFIS